MNDLSAGCCNEILFSRWVAKGGMMIIVPPFKLNSFDYLNSGYIKPNPLPKDLFACVFETSVQMRCPLAGPKPDFGQVPLEEIILEPWSIFNQRLTEQKTAIGPLSSFPG